MKHPFNGGVQSEEYIEMPLLHYLVYQHQPANDYSSNQRDSSSVCLIPGNLSVPFNDSHDPLESLLRSRNSLYSHLTNRVKDVINEIKICYQFNLIDRKITIEGSDPEMLVPHELNKLVDLLMQLHVQNEIIFLMSSLKLSMTDRLLLSFSAALKSATSWPSFDLRLFLRSKMCCTGIVMMVPWTLRRAICIHHPLTSISSLCKSEPVQ